MSDLLTTQEVAKVLNLDYRRFRSVCNRMEHLPSPVIKRGGRSQPAKYSAREIDAYKAKYDARREMLDAHLEYARELRKAKQETDDEKIDAIRILSIKFLSGVFDRPVMRGQYTRRLTKARMSPPKTKRIRVGDF